MLLLRATISNASETINGDHDWAHETTRETLKSGNLVQLAGHWRRLGSSLVREKVCRNRADTIIASSPHLLSA